MTATLYLDVETSDFARDDLPPEDPRQPALVQLAAVLADDQRTWGTLSFVLRQNQWAVQEGQRVPIAARAAAVHGIDDVAAERWGEPPHLVLHLLRRMVARAGLVVAHNVQFDVAAVDRALVWQNLPPVNWPEKYCTMRESAPLVGIPGHYGGYKWPKLSEAYFFFTQKELARHHDALYDVMACKVIHQKILEHQARAKDTHSVTPDDAVT